jgi:hypothetical protein
MRCPDCSKFVAFDTEVDPEENGDEAISGSSFTATYRRVLNCADCGTELKSAEIEVEIDLSGAENWTDDCLGSEEALAAAEACAVCAAPQANHTTEHEFKGSGVRAESVPAGDDEHDWDFSISASPSERTQTTDRNGKAIKSSRYMKRFYGVEITGSAKCNKCGLEVDIEGSNDEQASAFEEQV